MPNWAISSGCVVGTISTAIWLPFFASNAANLLSSAAICSALSVAVWSVTRRDSSGTATCAQADSASIAIRKPNAKRVRSSLIMPGSVAACRCGRSRRPEVDLGRYGDGFFVFHREGRLGLVAEHHRRQVGWKGAHRDVIGLHGSDVTIARVRDAVFGAFELCLQITEQAIRLELGIVLGNEQQARERAGQFALCCTELLERGLVVDQIGRRLDRTNTDTSHKNTKEHILLVRRITFHHVDQVRHQVGAALVLVQHLGPGSLDFFVRTLQRVVAAAGQGQYHASCKHPFERLEPFEHCRLPDWWIVTMQSTPRPTWQTEGRIPSACRHNGRPWDA